jgi:hypothetical protein
MTTDLLLSCDTKPSHISDLNVMLYNLMQKLLRHNIGFEEDLSLGWGEEMWRSSLRAEWPRI